MADQAVLKYLSIDTTFDPCYLSLDSTFNNVNEEFQKTVSFFTSHKLSLHPEKTKFMLISNTKFEVFPTININYNPTDGPQNPEIIFKMPCINEDPKPYAKFLGVLIDPQLSFKAHINSVSKKLSTALYFMRKARNILNERALKFIYYSTFHCHLIYAIQLWICCSESLPSKKWQSESSQTPSITHTPSPYSRNSTFSPFPC